MPVDLEKVKAWLADLQQDFGSDARAVAFVGEAGMKHIEALVAEAERLRAQVTNHEWVIKDMGRELRRLEGVRGGMR